MIATVAIVTATCAALAWLAHRRWMVVVVRGGSMSPTLHNGQQLLCRRGRRYRRGDLVVFLPPRPAPAAAEDVVSAVPDDAAASAPDQAPADDDDDDDLPYRIKRVAALAGEPVPPWLAAAGPPRVPAHHLAVSGDNPVSEDSRHFGFVPEDAVLGYVRVPAAAPAAGSPRR